MNTDALFQELPTSGTWSGACEVTMQNPAGEITGTATVHVTSDSHPEVTISIDGFQAPPEYDNNLVAFLNASPPKRCDRGVLVAIPASAEERRISYLEVKTESGTLIATSGLVTTSVFWGFGSNETLSLTPNDLIFCRSTNKEAKFWFMPLRGPFAEFYRPASAARHLLTLDNGGYISFSADGRVCGLQIFGKGKSPKHPLATYDAIAFGEVRGPANALEEIWAEVPRGLLSALSFTIGADVTVPWIETRGEDGQLVRRLFRNFGRRLTEDGFGAFSRVNELRQGSGIGPFLAAFFSVASTTRDALIVPLNLIRSGSPGSSNIEDSITDLVKALDNFCAAHGLTTQNLFNRLENNNRERVSSVLDAARTTLVAIRSGLTSNGRQDQADVVNVILSKIANATTLSRDFGIAVKDLLKHLNLQDAEVLESYYRGLAQQGVSWAGVLSAVRGEVIHKGFLKINDRSALRAWFNFARHLHDLCKRIVFREVNYNGFYQSSTNPWQGEYSVDRVRLGIGIEDLGFFDLPTHI